MSVFASRLFVVAAHPDDDAIGCGGTISVVTRGGGAVCIVYLTDGSRSHPESRSFTPEALRDLREAEALDALTELGVVAAPVFFRLPDSGLAMLSPAERSRTRQRLSNLIAAFEPDLILAPWRRDFHADHIVAGEIALEAARDAEFSGEFASYEIWLPIRGAAADRPANSEVRAVRVALDAAAIDAKRRAILAHRSQTTDIIDDPTGFRIDDALLATWVTPVEQLFYERAAVAAW
jgi:LmbE family N-acetylglucosaminyl deacetylase